MTRRGSDTQEKALAILRRSARPLSAYDLLAALRPSNPKIAPPTIYRALAALTERGRVHRVETMSAFVACQRERHDEAAVLSICDECGSVEESLAPALFEALTRLVGRTGFTSTRCAIEVRGLCGACGDERGSA